MINSNTYYNPECDKCERTFENSDGGVILFDSKSEAESMAFSNGWDVIDGKLICDDCIEKESEESNE